MLRKLTTSVIACLLSGIAGLAQMADPVDWKFETKKAADKEYVLVATAHIESPWHLYGMYIPEGGPIATSLTLKNHRHLN